jgi:DNA-binding protein H-NS
MSIDLSALGIDELEAVIADAQRLIKAKKKSHLKNARSQLEKVAADYGFTLEELVSGKANEDSAAPVKVRKPVEVRYRNPNNEQETWTGRGKQPRWLVAAIASGKSLADFLV